ncbi:MAG TPA: NAD(P) transhydrogenase subunit alpha [Gemmatimonadaceae bacterium]|nr:NAD(P) transhydrogenase subunit alpha [Gemmatimonadaceae bacterium]
MSDPAFFGNLAMFVLATFLGVELIGRVPPTLHTPLMSAANAVCGIVVIGAIIVAGGGNDWIARILGFAATALAMVNVVGGYAVTGRMLGMFRKDEKKKE